MRIPAGYKSSAARGARPGMAQVGLRVSVLLFPALVLTAAGALGACSSQSGGDPPPSDDSTDPDGNPPDRDIRNGSDAANADATLDGALADPDAEPHDTGVDAPAPPVDTGPPLDCTAVGSAGEPTQLGCTGLYASWPDRSIAATARAFTPAFTGWSDGAQKSRYISLPAGQTIDTSDMDEWRFPVGTKIWKEFRLNGLRVETRMLWKKTGSDWYRTSYVWSQDQSSAVENTAGVVNIWGTGYDIPPQSDCTLCHGGHLDTVLGFEAIGLSNPGASGFTMSVLVSEQRLSNPPTSSFTVPGNATQRAALGTLHANCGNACHSNSNYALAKDSGLFMRLRSNNLSSVSATDTYQTSVNVPSKFQGPGGGFYRIKPNDVAHSSIPYRDGYRDTSGERVQMPPLGTHVVDTAALDAVKAWVNAL